MKKILDQCKHFIKDDGMVFLCEFSYVDQPNNDFAHEMCTAKVVPGRVPQPFEPFHFFIDSAPNNPFEIFNIPANVMFQAAMEVGYGQVHYQLQYPNPEYEHNPIIRSYIDDCDGTDYLMRLKIKRD